VIEIDPYEAIITLAQADSGLTGECGDRIDIWHHYGQDSEDWALDAKSCIFVPIGGELARDDDVNFMMPVLQARCYGDSPFDCYQVWKKLMDITFTNARRVVTTTAGDALISYLHPTAGNGMPQFFFDEEIRPNGGMPYYSVQLQAGVSSLAV
jgi:hypothetical protein